MHRHLPFLQGSELADLIQNKNWSATSLKAQKNWPESLKSAIAIALSSGFPIAIYWGEDFTLLYNDAWSIIAAQKHPWALGKPGAVVWPELWDGIKQEFESVLLKGQSYRKPDTPIYMNRQGYIEECYLDYSLSPIVGADGKVGGVFNTVVETTYRVINERRNGIHNGFLAQAHTSNTLTVAYEKINSILANGQLGDLTLMLKGQDLGDKAVDVKVGNTIVQFFTDTESARNWLHSLGSNPNLQ